MSLIFDAIDGLIMSAMKEKNPDKTNAYKNIKTKLVEFRTAKSAKTLTEDAETKIIKKMVTELEESIAIFKSANREDLVGPAEIEMSYLKDFLPKEASIDDIKKVIEENITSDMTIKDMGTLVKVVKSQFKNVNGKLVADTVKSYLSK